MPINGPMFLFLAATVVAVFAFLSIAVWVATPSHERQARDRIALLRTVAEQPGENAALVLEMLREEDRRREAKQQRDERRGYLVGGSITLAVGAGLALLLAVTKPGGVWSVGAIPILVGVVLIATGLLMKAKSTA